MRPASRRCGVTRAPRGAGVTAATTARRAYAGPFTELHVEGSVRAPGLLATTRYRFTPGFIDARWTLRSGPGVAAAVTFPSWGRGASVKATLTDGRTVALGREPLPLSRVHSLHVMSERSGYRLTALRTSAGAAVRLVTPRPQPSNPNPGPTVEVTLAHARRSALAVRITVDSPSLDAVERRG